MSSLGRDVADGRQRVEQIMGMPIDVDVRDPDMGEEVLDNVFDWFRWVDRIFSTYRADSQISRLNRREITIEQLDPAVREVLERCEQLRFETNGYFDIRAPRLPPSARTWDPAMFPHAIDPSGLVKGWAVGRAAQLLTGAGANNFSINAGGDIWVSGSPVPGSMWRIGIQHPLDPHHVAAVVETRDQAVATSGEYERGTHIIDPHTGQPPQRILSVTITGPDVGTADAYATATFAMGQDGPGWTTQLVDYEAMCIMADHTVLYTPEFPAVGHH